MILDIVKAGMERILQERGLLRGDRALILQVWADKGVRATILEGKGRATRTLATATAEKVRGSPKDLRNGLLGALIARLNESKGGEP